MSKRLSIICAGAGSFYAQALVYYMRKCRYSNFHVGFLNLWDGGNTARSTVSATLKNYSVTLSMRSFRMPAGACTSTTSPSFFPTNACAIGDLMDSLFSRKLASCGLTIV